MDSRSHVFERREVDTGESPVGRRLMTPGSVQKARPGRTPSQWIVQVGESEAGRAAAGARRLPGLLPLELRTLGAVLDDDPPLEQAGAGGVGFLPVASLP